MTQVSALHRMLSADRVVQPVTKLATKKSQASMKQNQLLLHRLREYSNSSL